MSVEVIIISAIYGYLSVTTPTLPTHPSINSSPCRGCEWIGTRNKTGHPEITINCGKVSRHATPPPSSAPHHRCFLTHPPISCIEYMRIYLAKYVPTLSVHHHTILIPPHPPTRAGGCCCSNISHVGSEPSGCAQ